MLTAFSGSNAKIHTINGLRIIETSVLAENTQVHACLVLSETSQKACCVDSTGLLAKIETSNALRFTAVLS